MQTGRHDVLEVIFNGTWKIAAEDREFGPYSTEEEAVEVARTWAENAEKQGNSLSVLIRGGHPSYELFRQ